jgi:hypothetical protein
MNEYSFSPEKMIWALALVPLLIFAFRVVRRIVRGGAATGPESGLHYSAKVAQAQGTGTRASGVPGTMELSGTTQGCAWSATIEATPDNPDEARHGRVWRQSTRWRTAYATMPPGKFVVIMTLPEGAKAPPVSAEADTGFMATLARKAAAAAFGHYVSGYFGAEHGAMVDLASATPLAAGPGFAAFANDAAFARRLLDPATVDLLARQRALELARPRASNSGFGLLLAPAGVIIGTQYALSTADDLAPLVAFGAEMAERLKALRSA